MLTIIVTCYYLLLKLASFDIPFREDSNEDDRRNIIVGSLIYSLQRSSFNRRAYIQR